MAFDYSNIETLTEIKKGQCGTGLLIENDGHIIGECDTVKQIREDIESGQKLVCPDHFVVPALFQKYGIKNANGRIYPEDILKREVDTYIADRVNNRCALGALDHPACQLSDTKILTEKGWKDIADVQVGENVLTITEDGRIEIHPVLRKIDEEYEGDLVHFENRFFDYAVTPQHKLPLKNRHGKRRGMFTAEELYNSSVVDQGHSSLFRNGEWHNESDDYVSIPRLSDEELKGLHFDQVEKYSQDLVIPMEVWMKFMGIYLSEGWSSYNKRNHSGHVSICQKKIEVIESIRDMLEEFPLNYTETENQKSCLHTFSIYDMRLGKYLSQFGKCYDKYVPFEIKKQGKDMLRVFYDWFVLGDGRKRGLGKGNYYSDDVFSTSERLALDLNEIQMKIGYAGHFHKEFRRYDRMIEGREIKGENCHDMYFTHRGTSLNISLSPRRTKIYKEHYKGRVYCIEVQNHTFYTMDRSGHCLWTGNSSGLSGHDVAHNIIELHWEGHSLMGQLELNISPGYRKYGILSTSGDHVANMLLNGYLIGVSSRGVGSVKSMPGGVSVVGEDFSLICWDVVLEPSTPGAFIGKSKEELNRYVESSMVNNDKPRMDERIARISALLG